ncbi:MAG: DnaK suppressor protein, partial [Paracoccaceae bacterium]
MNESETSRFATLIRDRLAEIKADNRLGHDGQAVVELDQQSVGRLSRMDALQNQAMAKAQQNRRNTLALRLRAA